MSRRPTITQRVRYDWGPAGCPLPGSARGARKRTRLRRGHGVFVGQEQLQLIHSSWWPAAWSERAHTPGGSAAACARAPGCARTLVRRLRRAQNHNVEVAQVVLRRGGADARCCVESDRPGACARASELGPGECASAAVLHRGTPRATFGVAASHTGPRAPPPRAPKAGGARARVRARVRACAAILDQVTAARVRAALCGAGASHRAPRVRRRRAARAAGAHPARLAGAASPACANTHTPFVKAHAHSQLRSRMHGRLGARLSPFSPSEGRHACRHGQPDAP
jgi:hypothetical protein